MLKHCGAKRIAHFVCRKIGIKSFLQHVRSIAVSKAKLRGNRRCIQLQNPQLQPASSEECIRHVPIKLSPRSGGKASWSVHPVPAFLMKVKEDLQS
jgi:hypothetical protein